MCSTTYLKNLCRLVKPTCWASVFSVVGSDGSREVLKMARAGWKKLTDLMYLTFNVAHDQVMREYVFRLSGQRSIPTLVDGEVIIPDDEAMIAYLEERHGSGSAPGVRAVPGYVSRRTIGQTGEP